MKKLILAFMLPVLATSCKLPQPKETTIAEKHNYIVLLDLSDRLIVQKDQPNRDKELIKHIYARFEERVKKHLYIRSRDEIKVVIAYQKGSGLYRAEFEDRLYINMDNIPAVLKNSKKDERRKNFSANIDTLYQKAVFSKDPKRYNGADIWKYFYEDLKTDYSNDTLTKNFLFILTDGYPIVGKDLTKLNPVRNTFPNLKIVLVEAAPRDKDLEWDRIQELWQDWFNDMGIKDYEFIKRTALSKEKDEITAIIEKE